MSDKTNKDKTKILLVPQKYLHTVGLFVLVILLNMTGPFTTDMYLPSLPTIAADYNITTSEANITLISYYVCMTLGIIIIGPASDKFGRKKPLILSIIVFIISAIGCFVSPNLWTMVIARCFQGIAAGGMISISMAIVKDSVAEKMRGVTLSIVQSVFIIAPIVAPLIGSAIILVLKWNYVFLVLAIIGAVMLILACLYQETIPTNEKSEKSVLATYKSSIKVIKNKRFIFLLLSLCFMTGPFMAYLSSATYVYQNTFSCSPQEFSLYFSMASAIMMVGTILSIFACKKKTPRRTVIYVTLSIVAGLICSILLFLVGSNGADVFFLCFIIYFIANSFCRPFTTDILLSQHDGDTGSATAVLNFLINVFGVICMILGSIQFTTYIFDLAMIMLVFISVALIIWIYVLKTDKFKIRL